MYEDLMRELMCCPDVEYGCSRCEYKSSLHCRESLMKQAADAIEELNKCLDGVCADNDSLCKRIEELSKPHWISVADRLPEEWGVCLCWYEYYHVSRDAIFPEYGLGVWNSDDKCWCGEVRNGRSAKVLAWMPLPKPYEPPKEET